LTQKKIVIPATLEEAKASLGGIGMLLQAKEWERAAFVYAFTELGAPGPKGDRPDTGAISIREFARLGIVGLTKQDTVAEYRKAWESAMLDGAPDVKPGDTIVIPNLPWPPGFIDHRRGSHATEAEVAEGIKKVFRDPEKFAKIIDDPDIADAAAEAVATNPATRWRAEEVIRTTKPEPRTRVEPREANKAIEAVIKAIVGFWDHTVTHNGQEMTYREVIDTVRENPDAVLRGSLVPTADLHISLAKALDGMAKEAHRLAEPLQIAAGSGE
jgi:hypothetical protein